jgi:hypothetical protein
MKSVGIFKCLKKMVDEMASGEHDTAPKLLVFGVSSVSSLNAVSQP